MRLIHYSQFPIEKLEIREYSEAINQSNTFSHKPMGLWVSVEDDPSQGWLHWCKNENFATEYLTYKYEVKLKENAKILLLDTEEKIFEFSKKNCKKDPYYSSEVDSHNVDWMPTKEKYQSIIISPYQWECRLHIDTCWYYGWDVASGVIWDISCIKEFNLIDSIPVTQE